MQAHPTRFLAFVLYVFIIVTTGFGAVQAGEIQFKPSDATFLNPERGLYAHRPLVQRTRFARLRESGVSLVYAPIFLADFRDRPLSEARLAELDDGFNRIRDAGLKAIVRVSYSRRIGMPDASLEHVKEHLTQLRPLYEKHRDVIAFFQAGIIGAWGEWHASTNGLDTRDGRRQVMELLWTHLPKDRFIQLRTPMQKFEIFAGAAVSVENAFSDERVARVGYHNDCFLASNTDMGTYPRREVERWKQRVADETPYVPIGGETCRESERTNCETAQQELAQLHFSYLNRDYHRGVIRALAPCWKTITDRLGYRFQLVSCDVPNAVSPGVPFTVSIRIKNVGYAPMYNARPVVLAVLDGTKSVMEIEFTKADARRWLPGREIELQQSAQLPEGATCGSVGFALWLPDAAQALRQRPEYSVRFANEDVWNEKTGHNVLANHVPVQ